MFLGIFQHEEEFCQLFEVQKFHGDFCFPCGGTKLYKP